MIIERKGRILLLAAGGGFDIVTIQMIRDGLIDSCTAEEVETAGWLNPKFDHYFYSGSNQEVVVFEKPVNRIGPGDQIVRYRRTKKLNVSPLHGFHWYQKHGIVKPIVEAELPSIINRQVTCLSTRYDTDELMNYLSGFSTILVIDVGGDILYSGIKDNEVKTPAIDAYSLVTMRKLRERYNVNVKVMLVGIGMDGELTASHLEENLTWLEQRDGVLETLELNKKLIRLLRGYYKGVQEQYGGNTIRRILSIWEHLNSGTNLIEGSRYQLIDYKAWFNKMMLLDINKVIDLNPLSKANSFEEIKDILIRNNWDN